MHRFAIILPLALLAYAPVSAQDVIIYQEAPTAEDILRDLGELGKTRSVILPPARAIVATGSGTRLDAPGAAPAPPPGTSGASHIRPPREPLDLVGDKWVAAMVQFELNSHDVRVSEFNMIDQIAEVMQMKPDYRLVISGHADRSGGDAINIPLSGNRAAAVRRYLAQSHGIAFERMSVRGVGSDEPFVGYDEYDPINRRVQFGFQR